MRVLLENGADVESIDLVARPPLYYALKSENVEAVTLLL
jgi:hypothetical protein